MGPGDLRKLSASLQPREQAKKHWGVLRGRVQEARVSLPGDQQRIAAQTQQTEELLQGLVAPAGRGQGPGGTPRSLSKTGLGVALHVQLHERT